jgi:hypothetical protein
MNWTVNLNRGIYKLLIHPTHPDTVFAATNVGIFRTVDGGLNWVSVKVESLLILNSNQAIQMLFMPLPVFYQEEHFINPLMVVILLMLSAMDFLCLQMLHEWK